MRRFRLSKKEHIKRLGEVNADLKERIHSIEESMGVLAQSLATSKEQEIQAETPRVKSVGYYSKRAEVLLSESDDPSVNPNTIATAALALILAELAAAIDRNFDNG